MLLTALAVLGAAGPDDDAAAAFFAQPTAPAKPAAAPTPSPTPTPAARSAPGGAAQPNVTAPASAPAAQPAPDAALPAIAELRIVVSPEDVEKLRHNPRAFVPCVVHENGAVVLEKCGVKLKGAAGSFRGVDDRPALTLSTNRFGGKGRFHGLEKVHLNNSVQDESLVNEWLSAEVFREAGYPAARVAHARVSLNGRDLGMYVVKEGLDEHFLRRHFASVGGPAGTMYDGGFCTDLDAELERDEGKGPVNRADLRAIVEACRDPSPQRSWATLEKLVDIEMLLRMIALERLICHWDGYTNNRNNYRVYFPPRGKAVLIPHGMDQVFLDPNYDALGGANGMLAAAVLRNPEWGIAYRSELARLVERFDPAALAARVNAVQSRLQPAVAKVSRRAAAVQAQRVREVLSRVTDRARMVREQSSRPVPKPLEFLAGEASLVGGWEPGAWNETPDAEVGFVEIDGAVWGKITCGPSGRCVRSFRRTVLLGPGRYRLEAEASAEGLVPLEEPGAPGRGAGVRISGAAREGGVTGTDRRMVSHTFTVDAMRDVVLVVELRAAGGSVAFRAGSLKLVRVPEPAR